jgi:hypothetical protein
MVVNFRARGISRGARKLAQTATLKLKKKKKRTGDLTFHDLINTWIIYYYYY